MYEVYADGICIYSDKYTNSGTVNGVSPTLELKDNTAGTFTVTLPVGNPGYDSVTRLVSEIVVKRDGEEIWGGRVISEETDFYNSRALTCEGELAYLNDTTVPPTVWENCEVYDFLEQLLDIYNEKISSYGDKIFSIGAVAENFDGQTISFTSSYETVLDIINSQLIDVFGGHLRIRRLYNTNGVCVRYLDYLDGYINTVTQEIRFGKNLLDFTRNWDMSDLATVVVARGAKDSSTDEYLDVSEVNDGSIYVVSDEAVGTYGWIEVVVDWEDVTDAEELLELAQAYLSEEQFDEMSIEISAVDLRYLSSDYQAIELLDNVRVISSPHGLDRLFPVTEVSIQLDAPENSTYVLNRSVADYTSAARSENDKIISKIENLTSDETLLEKAQTNASQLLELATQGYVTIITNSYGAQTLYISTEPAQKAYNFDTDTWNYDYGENGVRVWRWNANGLGYSDGTLDSDGNVTYSVAITYDGQISADMITTGAMLADRIRGGMLCSVDNNVIWDLNKGGSLTIKSGSIMLGKKESGNSYNFSVSTDGVLYSESGTIGGFTIESSKLYNSHLSLHSTGLGFLYDGETFGTYGTAPWALQPSKLGLSTLLEHDSNFVSWSHLDSSSDDYYTPKLGYAATTLYVGNIRCDECGAQMTYDSDTAYFTCSNCGYTRAQSGDDIKMIPSDSVFFDCDIECFKHTAYRLFIDSSNGGALNGYNGPGDGNTMIMIPYWTSNAGSSISVQYMSVYVRNGMLVKTTDE